MACLFCHCIGTRCKNSDRSFAYRNNAISIIIFLKKGYISNLSTTEVVGIEMKCVTKQQTALIADDPVFPSNRFQGGKLKIVDWILKTCDFIQLSMPLAAPDVLVIC